MAYRSNSYLEGIVEDVLIRINELIFPVDFYIIVMDDEFASNSTYILLGRPFIETTKTKIDVHKGILSCEFDGEIVTFNIFYAMKYPNDSQSVFHVNVIKSLCKPGHPSRMPLVRANHNIQPSHLSRMSLAKANHNTQSNIP